MCDNQGLPLDLPFHIHMQRFQLKNLIIMYMIGKKINYENIHPPFTGVGFT